MWAVHGLCEQERVSCRSFSSCGVDAERARAFSFNSYSGTIRPRKASRTRETIGGDCLNGCHTSSHRLSYYRSKEVGQQGEQ